ncbi:hypothetical protein [Arenimonas maotaiensis]|uniref:hypothetical protein n=1 Tax=Arenimonas maotaiensis TaxID=1446479 RepID=UPI00166C0898|nr:hypothetical protein [Arenimonas maotaiensis]
MNEFPSSLLDWALIPFTYLLVAFSAMAFALIPALVIGVPAYSCLAVLGWARWWSATMLGAITAALVGSPLGSDAAMFCSIYGVCIAFFLHRAYQAGANNSFKRTAAPEFE